jgi:murein DD-endopeptidase MepM/ murein hydrolase activator NlpD
MENKAYTLILTSNRRGETRSLTVSSSWVKASITLGIIFFVLAIGVTVDYVGLLLQEGESKRLKAENAKLEAMFQEIEGKVASLEGSLDRIKTLTTKIKLITNIEDEERTLKLSIGPRANIDEDFAEFERTQAEKDRGPAATEFHQDAIFLEKPPLDQARGELAASTFRNYANLSVRIDKAVASAGLREQGVIKLQELLVERQSILNSTPSIKPTRGWFTSRFGYRIDPFSGKNELHLGLDMAASPGTPVIAPADGVVSYVGYESGYGKIVAIDHGYGVRTRFAHNSQIYVSLGQKVKRRDVIAAVGSTGRSSGPHLHYEVRVNDIPVDPINYILNE